MNIAKFQKKFPAKILLVLLLLLCTLPFSAQATQTDSNQHLLDQGYVVIGQVTESRNEIKDTLTLAGIVFIGVGVLGISGVIFWSVSSPKKAVATPTPAKKPASTAKKTSTTPKPKPMNIQNSHKQPVVPKKQAKKNADIEEKQPINKKNTNVNISSSTSQKKVPPKADFNISKVSESSKSASKPDFDFSKEPTPTKNINKFDTQEILKEFLDDK